MMKHTWLVAVLALAACGRCGTRAPVVAEPIERLLPKRATAVVVVPQLASAGQHLLILERLKVAGFVSALQGFPSAHAVGDAVVAQLGIDVRSAEAMLNAGIDGSRGVGVALMPSGQPVLVVPVADAAKLHRTIEQLASRRLGAGAGGVQTIEGIEVKTFAPQQGQPPKVGYVLARGHALISSGADIAALASVAALGEAEALSTDEGYAAAKKANADSDALLYVPTGSSLLAKSPLIRATASLSLTSRALEIRFDATPKPAQPWLEALTPASAVSSPAGALPNDAFLTVRYDGDPSKLGPVAMQVLGPAIGAAFEAAKFDVNTEIFSALQPGIRVALSLADRPPLDRGMPSLDLRTTNPFRYVHLSGLASVKDAGVVTPTLDRVAELAPKFGATMRRVDREGTSVMSTTYAAGEGVHFASRGTTVMFASPMPRLDALRASAPAPTPEAAAPSALWATLDLRRLADSVRALPDGAWGIGGFAIKATTVRWLDAIDDLQQVSVDLGVHDGVIRGRVALSLNLESPGDAGR